MQDGRGTAAMGLAAVSLPDLVTAWAHGWAVSRAVAAPVAVPGGWRLQVGLAGHRLRYVLPAVDHESLARLAWQEHAPGTWIKIADAPETLRDVLKPGWVMADTCYLMTTAYTINPEAVPPPYSDRTTTTGRVAAVTIVNEAGEIAASGRYAPSIGSASSTKSKLRPHTGVAAWPAQPCVRSVAMPFSTATHMVSWSPPMTAAIYTAPWAGPYALPSPPHTCPNRGLLLRDEVAGGSARFR